MTRFPRPTTVAIATLAIMTTLPLTGCLMVGGYSSRGGWFIWPGSFGFLIVLLHLFLFLRGRR